MPESFEKACANVAEEADRINAENLSLEGAAGESRPMSQSLQRRLAYEQLECNVRGSVAASRPASKEKTAHDWPTVRLERKYPGLPRTSHAFGIRMGQEYEDYAARRSIEHALAFEEADSPATDRALAAVFGKGEKTSA